MKLHPRLSRAALELVMRFETFQPQARPAVEGGWTIGYGHTRSAREGAHVSRADGEALLLYDLSIAAGQVEQALFAPVSQRQFEALTAFCFNIGAANFAHSTALARVNAGAHLTAADEIERWRHAELGAGAQVVDALVRRRAAEKAHFLGLPEGFSKSPSAVLRPIAGGETVVSEAIVCDTVEAEAPVVTSATLDAANSVQARLRELVPEPEPQAHAPPPELAPSLEPTLHADAEPEAPPFPELEPPLEDEPEEDEPLSPIDTAPYPPAPALEAEPAAANDVAAPIFPAVSVFPAVSAFPTQETALDEAALDNVVLLPEPAVAPEPAATPVPPEPRAPLKLDRRAAYAVLTGVGACLFMIAAVLILGGKPELANLGLGVVGALVMAPGVYGLLGPRPPEGV